MIDRLMSWVGAVEDIILLNEILCSSRVPWLPFCAVLLFCWVYLLKSCHLITCMRASCSIKSMTRCPNDNSAWAEGCIRLWSRHSASPALSEPHHLAKFKYRYTSASILIASFLAIFKCCYKYFNPTLLVYI